VDLLDATSLFLEIRGLRGALSGRKKNGWLQIAAWAFGAGF